MQKFYKILGFVLFLSVLISCASNIDDLPSWIEQDVFIADGKLYGVGYSSLLDDFNTCLSMAVLSARSDILEFISVDVETFILSKTEYISDLSKIELEQIFKKYTSTFSGELLSHVVEDTYFDDNKVWVLISIDLN